VDQLTYAEIIEHFVAASWLAKLESKQ